MGVFGDLIDTVNLIKNNKAKWKREAILQYTPKDSSYCKDADKFIKELDVRLAQYRKDALSKDFKKKLPAQEWIKILDPIRSDLQIKFVQKDCANVLENMKAKETAGIIGKEIEKYEDDVLSGSGKQQKQLFVIGGVVLLGALGLILYSRKK